MQVELLDDEELGVLDSPKEKLNETMQTARFQTHNTFAHQSSPSIMEVDVNESRDKFSAG